jgi:hypothetical protein
VIRQAPVGESSAHEFLALLLSDWLESWRAAFPRHGLARQWTLIALISLTAALGVGALSCSAFRAIAHHMGPRMPDAGVWLGPFLMTAAYGWFFLTTIWLGRTYRRRDRVVPLLLSPLPFPHLAAYLMLRDTGLVGLLVTILALPFLLGGLIGMGADGSAVALAVPLWCLTLAAALAMADVTILVLYRLLPAGWEGPLSFAAANVGVLLLPMLTGGLSSLAVPFYWPGLLAAKVLSAAPGWPRLQALGGLAAMTAGLLMMVVALTRTCVHANWSKSDELVPSPALGKLSLLKAGQGPVASVILKDWMLISRAWGESLVLVILVCVLMRLRANMGLPMLQVTGAPLLGTLLAAWALIEFVAFLGEGHREGPNTLLYALGPMGVRKLVWAKFVAIAVPRLLIGEAALAVALWQGKLGLIHAAIGQGGLILMVTTLTWLEVAHALDGDAGRLGRWLGLWARFFGFWRLLVVYPVVGLFCVLATQVAAIAWDQHVSGMTGLCFGLMGLGACAASMLSSAIVRRKLGV